MLNEVLRAISCHFYSLPTSSTTFISNTDFPKGLPKVSPHAAASPVFSGLYFLFRFVFFFFFLKKHYLKQFKVMDQVRFWWSVTSGQEPNIQLSLLILPLVLILVFQKV